ncbi:MAG: hypothetical protein M3042_09300 [Actinomycetota bacterium]|nr:hypothetical protein [Actinomycetota bacterium]
MIALATVLSTIFAAALLTSRPASAGAGTCTVSDKLVNSCRPWLGASVGKYPNVSTGLRAQVEAHEQRIGRQLDIVHSYHPVGSLPLSPDEQYFINRAGTLGFINWRPAAVWSDAAGGNATVNAQIDQVADSFNAVAPHKVFFTLFHEPENDVSAGNCTTNAAGAIAGSPADYRAMWRNVRSRFDAKGVTNVVWVMDYMNYPAWDCLVGELYPGNDLVDWVMFNAYGTGSQTWAGKINHFQDLLTSTNSPATDFLSKPWGIVEWNANASTMTPAQSLAYYDQAKAALDTTAFPRLRAYLVFDNVGPEGNENRVAYDAGGIYDAAKQDHYTAFAQDPAFADPPAPPPNADVVAPTAPTGVTAATNANSVDLSWQAATDDVAVTGYNVYRDGARVAVLGPVTSYSDTGLADGRSYRYAIEAFDAAGNIGPTATVTADLPDVTAPGPVPGLAAVGSGPDQVRLSWQPATDNVAVGGYHLYRDGVAVATTGPAVTAFDDNGAVSGRTYGYQIEAFDAAGNVGPLSPVVSSTPPDVTPPSTPTGLAVQSVTATQVGLGWQPSSDNLAVAGYHVYRDGVVIGSATQTSYQDPNLSDGRTYSYMVTAFDAAGNESSVSPAINATTPDVTAPTAPARLAGTVQSGSVNVQWQASLDNVAVAGYHVTRDGAVVATTTATSWVDPSTTQGRSYTYAVRAFDAAGNESVASTSVVVSVPDTSAPTAPGTPVATVQAGAVKLTWTAATDNVGVTSYRVTRNGTTLATVAGPTYTDAAVQQGQTYSYAVIALDAAGNAGPASAASSVNMPDTVAPATPTGLRGAAGARSVTLTWTAATDNVAVVGYQIYRGTAKIATAAGTTYTNVGLKTGTSYTYKIRAYDAAGNLSAFTATVTVKAR